MIIGCRLNLATVKGDGLLEHVCGGLCHASYGTKWQGKTLGGQTTISGLGNGRSEEQRDLQETPRHGRHPAEVHHGGAISHTRYWKLKDSKFLYAAVEHVPNFLSNITPFQLLCSPLQNAEDYSRIRNFVEANKKNFIEMRAEIVPAVKVCSTSASHSHVSSSIASNLFSTDSCHSHMTE